MRKSVWLAVAHFTERHPGCFLARGHGQVLVELGVTGLGEDRGQ